MKFLPNGSRLLLRDVEVRHQVGGIYLPPSPKRFEVECEVVAVGGTVKRYKVGDIVFVHVNDGRHTTIGDQAFRIYDEEKVLGQMLDVEVVQRGY